MQIGSLVAAFVQLGYSTCADGTQEPSLQKVALYADQFGRWTHAARQLPNGGWTSKLGKLEDIEHEFVDTLTGQYYGSVHCFMARPLP